MSFVPFAPSFGEYKELASSFLCGFYPLSSPEEFKVLYEVFKKEYPRADHYPYAYRIGDICKSSDDGEPGATAGRPMLSLLQDKDLSGAFIVARYFGGTKLGTPRLRRAFLSSCEEALSHAKLGAETKVYAYTFTCSYSEYERLKREQDRYGYAFESVSFDVDVRVCLCARDTISGLGEKLGLPGLSLPEPETRIVLMEAHL